MIKNMTLPLILEINIKDNYFHIFLNWLNFMYRVLDVICFKHVHPPWVGKKLQIYSVKITEKCIPQSTIYYFYWWNNKKLSTPNSYTKSQVFLPFLPKALLPLKVSQFSEAATSLPFPNMILSSVP